MKGDGHGYSPPDPKHFVKLYPEAVTPRNNILTSRCFIAVISTMGKQTLDFESSTVPALTVQPRDIVGLSFSELGYTQYNFFLRCLISNKRCEYRVCHAGRYWAPSQG